MLEEHHGAMIPAVVSLLLGFLGPDDSAKATAFLREAPIDAVCVVGKYTIAKQLDESDEVTVAPVPTRVHAEGDDALGAFLALIEGGLEAALEGRMFVHPSRLAYYAPEI